jgi:hypothetical protein
MSIHYTLRDKIGSPDKAEKPISSTLQTKIPKSQNPKLPESESNLSLECNPDNPKTPILSQSTPRAFGLCTFVPLTDENTLRYIPHYG